MKLDLFGLPQGGAGFDGEAIIVDSFAGGGGASTGIEMALGRSPDIAINHNADALAMHEVNHPATLHLSKNIWQVDPIEAVGRRRVGLAWFSPDCKHFSKAKGGRPVKRAIRDLAWVVVLWARRVRPEIIMLENVEEFRDWGPVTAEGKPCPERKGQTFEQWTGELKRLGYKMEWRELRACDYGAPTIRKRFFMIARRDGRPIVWPERTHGNPNKAEDAALIASGKLRPWRTAAEIIDWSLPCPSIFETSAEILATHGVRAVRPLADATMRRIARGVVRYVLEAKKPFVVKFQSGSTGHSIDEPLATVTANSFVKRPGGAAPLGVVVPSFVGCGGRAGQSAPRGGDEPLGTLTAKPDLCVVAPVITAAQQGGSVRAVDAPLHTITASPKDQNAVVVPVLATLNHGGGRDHAPKSLEEPFRAVTASRDAHALVAPILVETAHGEVSPNGVKRWGAGAKATDEPLGTGTLSNNHAVAAVHLTSYYGEGDGGLDRGRDPGTPLPTDTAGGNRHGIIAATMVQTGYGEREGQAPRSIDIDKPLGTQVAGAAKHGVVAAFLAQHNNDSRRIGGVNPGRPADEPMATVTASGAQQAVIAAHMMRQFGESVGHAFDEPSHTDTAAVNKSAVIAAHLQNMRGSDRRDQPVDAPAPTATAGGNHAALIAPFLTKYYGEGLPNQGADEPVHTVTTLPRHGLVTVEIDGQSFAIADIGMRMLTPRERFRAQGFPDTYIIDRRPDGSPITATVQGSCCGNSVCPPLADALVRANCGHLARVREAAE